MARIAGFNARQRQQHQQVRRVEIRIPREFLASLPPLHFYKDKVACSNDIKAAVMQQVGQQSASLKASAVNGLDGLRFEFEGAWMLIRASGTEPAIRVLAEAQGQAYARSLLSRGIVIVQDAIKKVSA